MPVYKTRGSFFAARVRQGGRVQASLLQTTDVRNGFPVLDEIDLQEDFRMRSWKIENDFPVNLVNGRIFCTGSL